MSQTQCKEGVGMLAAGLCGGNNIECHMEAADESQRL